MFEKIIEFSSHEDYVTLEQDFPIPSKLNIPEWFKKLEHTVEDKTVKGCMPFLDSLTAGYLLKIPQDIVIHHNIDSKNDKNETIKDAVQISSLHRSGAIVSAKSLNLNTNIDSHPIKQLEGSPHVEKNKNLPFHKISNPWKIKTPKGYSCLFVPPLNNSDDRFSIIPSIVDTDTFPNEINFPIVINGDKYPVLKTILKKGTIYVQVIPFKRDSWKMNIKKRAQKEIQNSRIFYELTILNTYKNKFWNKKSWK
jgi:hypothetical protein